MSKGLEHEIREWLDAERTRSDEVAEQALRRAFAELGRRRPAAGFADRVLLRAGRLAPALPVWRAWWLRASAAGLLLAAGLVLALLPVWWPIVGALAHALGSPLMFGVSHWTGRWVSAGFTFWTVVEDVTAAVRASLVTPTAVLVLSVNVLLAAGSLFGLKRLLKAPEELMPW